MDLIPLKLSVTTCYLIPAAGRYVLADTGYAEDWDLFRRRLKEADVALSEISHILLTHHHDDHCGLLAPILGENPSVRVILSPQCRELIQRGENDRTHGGGLLNRRVAFLIRNKQLYVSLVLREKIGRENNLKFAPYFARDCDLTAEDGMRLSELGLELNGRILATPGHTPDSISVLFDDGDCLAGDAAADMLRFAGTKHCVIFVGDLTQYYKSWEKLIAAGALRIFPAHGRPFPVRELTDDLWKNRPEDLVP